MDIMENRSSEKRLVDADKLLTNVVTVSNSIGKVTWSAVPAIDILTAPTIDAVPVVRCRDCIKISPSVTEIKNAVWCRTFRAYMPCDGFCSYGERKEGAD